MYSDPADRYIQNTDARVVDWLIDFIKLFGTNKSAYKDLVSNIAKVRNLDVGHAHFMKVGVFRLSAVISYVTSHVLGEQTFRYPSSFESSILEKLYRYDLSRNMKDSVKSLGFDVWLSEENVSRYNDLDCIDNAIRGTGYILAKYHDSLCHIEVENGSGDVSGGTGFVVHPGSHDGGNAFVITNRHVIDPERWKLTRIESPAGELKFGAISVSNEYDLAAIKIKKSHARRPFNLSLSATYLQDVVSMGYPFVARVNHPVMMAHAGQINGFADTIDGERLIFFSANVSPGSSGGPVLNELGLVVGVTTQANEGEYAVSGHEKQRILPGIHHAAVPAGFVLLFLAEISRKDQV